VLPNAEPSEADYFFIPSVDNAGWISRAEVLSYVKARYPRAWARAQGGDHIMMGTNDAGARGYFGERESNPDAMRLIFLSHMGLWLGSKRGGITGAHIPGQDIVVPSNQPQMPGTLAASPYMNAAAAFNASVAAAAAAASASAPAARPTLLFFAGTVHRSDTVGSHNVRWAVANASEGHKDMHFVDGSTPSFHAEMVSATFCLGAPGQGGGWGRRTTTSALHGCVPVFIQDNTSSTLDELLPWRTFSLRIPEADVSRLHGTLKQLQREPGRVAALQRALACVWPRFVYSTIFGGAAQEDGHDDAFESVIEILRRRLARPRAGPGAWPANGDVGGGNSTASSGGGSDALARWRRLERSGVQLADVCEASSVAAGGDGAAPRGGSVPPKLPCRHWSHPLDGRCADLPPELKLGDPSGPIGGAVCVGVTPPCMWPRATS
jgi:hypothetical protein